MKTLVFDPSGNYNEGKGTTGWAQYYDGNLITVGQLRAAEFKSRNDYWDSHIKLIQALEPDVLVVESFRLYANKAKAQINSEFETPQLIGMLVHWCYSKDVEVIMQDPAIKSRFSNKILLHKKIITQDKSGRYYAVGVSITNHILDAIRHGEYYKNFGYKKERKNGSSRKI